MSPITRSIQIVLSILVWLAASPSVPAQDAVYLVDQTKITGELTDITPDKVSLRVTSSGSTIKFSYGSDRAVLVVNRWGRMLCLNYLRAQSAEEQGRLIRQLMDDTTLPASDIIIRRSPLEAIAGEIAYDQGDVVNYTTPADSAVASLPKSQIAAIFYRTGRHELFADIPMLCDNPALLTGKPASKLPAATTPVSTPDSAAATAGKATRMPPVVGSKLTLTDEEYATYRSQGLQRVQQFGTLLSVVADKAADAGEKAKATKEILRLFKPDAVIEVSSSARTGVATTYRIEDYLRRLRLLPYKSVSLEWSEIQYVQELTQQADGNYYGKIRGEQRFTGFNAKGDVQYGDITAKEVDVMLTPYQKQINGDEKQQWFILLGNIGVVTTQ